MGRPKTKVDEAAIKAYYKEGVRGRGVLNTAKAFNTTHTIVRGIVRPAYVKRMRKINKDRYYSLKAKGICHMCGNKLK